MLGDFCESIFPTSQLRTLATGSKVYLPWVAVRVQFNTLLGIGISNLVFSSFGEGNSLINVGRSSRVA